MNRNKLADDLTDAFIQYQYRLDRPFPSPDDTQENINRKYRVDNMFRYKVQDLVGGVMRIIDKNLEGDK
jgi:hypothetical protein